VVYLEHADVRWWTSSSLSVGVGSVNKPILVPSLTCTVHPMDTPQT
jgi:hypothetical protein